MAGTNAATLTVQRGYPPATAMRRRLPEKYGMNEIPGPRLVITGCRDARKRLDRSTTAQSESEMMYCLYAERVCCRGDSIFGLL